MGFGVWGLLLYFCTALGEVWCFTLGAWGIRVCAGYALGRLACPSCNNSCQAHACGMCFWVVTGHGATMHAACMCAGYALGRLGCRSRKNACQALLVQGILLLCFGMPVVQQCMLRRWAWPSPGPFSAMVPQVLCCVLCLHHVDRCIVFMCCVVCLCCQVVACSVLSRTLGTGASDLIRAAWCPCCFLSVAVQERSKAHARQVREAVCAVQWCSTCWLYLVARGCVSFFLLGYMVCQLLKLLSIIFPPLLVLL